MNTSIARADSDAPEPSVGPPGLDWTFVATTLLTIGLITTWLLADHRTLFGLVLPHDAFGSDAVLYSLGARAWLTGGDPWTVSFRDVFLAAPPPSLLPFVLTSWLPELVVRWTWVTVGFAALFVTVVRLGLPIWCVLFPPAVYASLHGSVETTMVMVLVLGPRWLAPVLKPYAAIPLLIQRRSRDLIVAAVIVIVTVPLFPWRQFLLHLNEIGPRLAAQSEVSYSAYGQPILFALTAVALTTLDARLAAFAIVPSLIPAAQEQYGAMLLPVIDRLPLVGFLGVLPYMPYTFPVSIIATSASQTLVRLSRRAFARSIRTTKQPPEAHAR